MWILPKQLHALSGAPDTEAFLSDLNEQSQACGQSLLVRSKPSPARTWLLKWKRDSWTQHLFGRILRHSHAKSFVTKWTSLWQDILANHLVPQENGLEQKTPDTSGPTSNDQYLLFDLDSASLKMSKDTSRWDSPQSSAIWKNWVTRCRGEYSQRLKSGHLTKGKECSSWPIVTANEDSYRIGGESQQSKCLLAMARRGEMTQWPTPQAQDTQRTPEAYAAAKEKRGGKMFLSLNIAAQLHGQAAPASSSTNGSRQGLWGTPSCMDTLPARSPEALARAKQKGGCKNLREEVVQWGTPSVTATGGPTGLGGGSGNKKKMNALGPEGRAMCSGKLNPMWVCTLMGLPMGWVTPSCPASVIRNWQKFVNGWSSATTELTNSASSATESSPPPQQELL